MRTLLDVVSFCTDVPDEEREKLRDDDNRFLSRAQVCANAPESVPDHYVLFNAPRPLVGQLNWSGPYRRGIFYTAIDPDDVYSIGYAEETMNLDGGLVTFLSYADILEYSRDYWYNYIKEHPQSSLTVRDCLDIYGKPQDLFERYFDSHDTITSRSVLCLFDLLIEVDDA